MNLNFYNIFIIKVYKSYIGTKISLVMNTLLENTIKYIVLNIIMVLWKMLV